MLKKIIEFGIYLLLFILPWQTRLIIKPAEIGGKYFEYGTYSLYASDILLLLLMVLGAVYFFLKKPDIRKIKHQKVWLALVIFDIAIFISIFLAADSYLAFYKYANFLLGIVLFSLIAYFPYDKARAMLVFGASLFIQALIGAWQFINSYSPANKWLGMAEHDSINAGVSVVEAMGNLGVGERWLRAYGALDHPNVLGGFLAIGLFLLIVFLVRKSRFIHTEDREESRRDIFLLNIAYYPAIIAIGAGILLSFSRSAWLAVFFSLFIYLLVISFKKDKLSQKYFLPLVLYLGVIIFILSIPFNNLIEARINKTGRLENISTTERANSEELAKKVITDKWLFGVGVGNYTLTIKENYAKDKEVYFYQPVHNTFYLIWAETGIFGLFGFILLLIFLFMEGRPSSRIKYKFPLFLGLVILLFFDHWWWSLHFGFLYFCLIIGFSLSVFELDEEKKNVV
jgi:O-antigen ligase